MVTKGVLVAAGYGTRFLPITRTIPKEMLPIVDRPAIDLVVSELIEAGVTDLLVITSRRKKALDDWFDRDPELEAAVADDPVKLARVMPPKVRTTFIRQEKMGGTGDALRLARQFAGNDPVLVAFPDDLLGQPNASAQLIAAHEATGGSVLAAADLGDADVSRYGVLDATREGDLWRVRGVVEKPAPGTAPSSLISVGRYLYTPDFFAALDARPPAHGGEWTPMDAMAALGAANRLVATVLKAPRWDTGTPLGWLQALTDAALADPRLAEAYAVWLRERLAARG